LSRACLALRYTTMRENATLQRPHTAAPSTRIPSTAQMNPEFVVLVDEQNTVVGTMSKAEVHGVTTPLHRAFSSFVFRLSDRLLLLQQRSSKKQTWPVMWSNSCCGHPAPGESTVDAARRRLKYELGLEPGILEEVAPYRYCFTRDGVMENEICPILVGMVDHEPVMNPNEVQAVRWREWTAFLADIQRDPTSYTEWCVAEARILHNSPRCRELIGI
jgi:isopentenyl-diphosphate delta-isomerase